MKKPIKVALLAINTQITLFLIFILVCYHPDESEMFEQDVDYTTIATQRSVAEKEIVENTGKRKDYYE